ncbi:DnaB-like helicase C-terminal domain-containing protein [Sharpea azabuensis]
MILISQFNRDQDKRIDPDPKMSDFNGSSDIENIANVAI